MSTSNLFVELIVIGAGVLIWLALLVFTALGFPSLEFGESLLFVSAIPLLATTYVAGIIWDRVVDYVFEKIWVDRWRVALFPNKKDYYEARRTILTKSERLSDLLEYGRSRMRICRSWTLNSILIGFSLNIFLYKKFLENDNFEMLIITATSISVAFSIGAWFAWSSLVKTEYRKIKEQSVYLQEISASST